MVSSWIQQWTKHNILGTDGTYEDTVRNRKHNIPKMAGHLLMDGIDYFVLKI